MWEGIEIFIQQKLLSRDAIFLSDTQRSTVIGQITSVLLSGCNTHWNIPVLR